MEEDVSEASRVPLGRPWATEDWLAVWCGGFLLLASFLGVWLSLPNDFHSQLESDEPVRLVSPLKRYLAAPSAWSQNPIEAFLQPAKDGKPGANVVPGVM